MEKNLSCTTNLSFRTYNLTYGIYNDNDNSTSYPIYNPAYQYVAPRILKCEYCGTSSYSEKKHGEAFRCESCGAPLNVK